MPTPDNGSPPQHHGSTGCLTGGCLVPFLFFLFAASQGDLGGPLFWPALSLVLGGIGFLIGATIARKLP